MILDAQLVHARAESVWVQAEPYCCTTIAGDTPVGPFECLDDVGAFNFFKLAAVIYFEFANLWYFDLQPGAGGDDDRPLDYISQLAHVPRPRILLQRAQRTLRDALKLLA